MRTRGKRFSEHARVEIQMLQENSNSSPYDRREVRCVRFSCAICLEDFTCEDTVAGLECDHYYHDHCIAV